MYLYHDIVWGDPNPSTGDTLGTCVCGYTETKHTHIFSETEYNYNENGHWHKAICADATDDLKKDNSDYSRHWMKDTGEVDSEKGHKIQKCDCGYEIVSSSHLYSTEYDSDDTSHWKKLLCKCNVYSTTSNHTWSNWSTTDPETGNQTRNCTVCNREGIKHNHIYSDTVWVPYPSRESFYHTHPAICNYDESCKTAVSLSKTDHDNATYKVQGTMDPVTGDAEEYCKDCGYVFGVKHTHIFSEEYAYDSTDHWKIPICSDGERLIKAVIQRYAEANMGSHTYSAWKCIDEQNGTWARSCTVCPLKQTKHECAYQKGDAWTCDETRHWRARLCQTSNCGAEFKDRGLHNYDGVEWSERDSATGNRTRTCKDCGYEQIDHQHVKASDEWVADETGHWHPASCHEDGQADKATHGPTDTTAYDEFGTRDVFCTICNYVTMQVHDPSHRYSATYEYDDEKHWKPGICHFNESCEGIRRSEGVHVYENKAGEDAICKYCGYLKTHYHKFASTYEFDSTNHWHPATCGHDDQIGGNAAHTFVESGVGSRRCSVCGYEEGHTHTFADTWTTDSTNHWHAATCGDTTKTMDNAPHSFIFDAGTSTRSCSVCGYSEAHTHQFAEAYSHDDDNHWHEATCGDTNEKGGFAGHNFGDWSYRNESTGNKTRTCRTCKYVQIDHVHVYTEATWVQGDTTHYHRARCEHSDLRKDEAAHNYVDQGEPDSAGMVTLKCRVCQKEITEHRHSWETISYIIEAHTTRDQGRRSVRCTTCNEAKDEDYRIEIPSSAPTLAMLGNLRRTAEPNETDVPICVPGATYYTFGVFPMTEKENRVTVDETIICLENEDFDYCLGSDNNWYYKSGETWYKVEPIKWRMDTKNNERTLIAEKVLSAGHTSYRDVMEFFSGTGISEGRGLYQMAFTDAQKATIKTVTKNISSYGEHGQWKVFLPDVVLSMGGGSIEGSRYAPRKATDFAKSMGAMNGWDKAYCDYWILPGTFTYIKYIGSERDDDGWFYFIAGPRSEMDYSAQDNGKYGEVPALVLND